VLQRLSPSPLSGVDVMSVVFTCNQLCQMWCWCPVLQILSHSPSPGDDVMSVVFTCNQLGQVPSVAETIPSPSLGVDVMNVVFACCVYTKAVICRSTDHVGNGGQSQTVMSVLAQTMQGTVCLPSELMLLVIASCL
jgi:hypothetical protein